MDAAGEPSAERGALAIAIPESPQDSVVAPKTPTKHHRHGHGHHSGQHDAPEEPPPPPPLVPVTVEFYRQDVHQQIVIEPEKRSFAAVRVLVGSKFGFDESAWTLVDEKTEEITPQSKVEEKVEEAPARRELNSRSGSVGSGQPWQPRAAVVHSFISERVFKITTFYTGVTLHFYHNRPLNDSRFPPGHPWKDKQKLIKTEEAWADLIKDLPWTADFRRARCADFLNAKAAHGMSCTPVNDAIVTEALHGLWEMAVNRAHHTAFTHETLGTVVTALHTPKLELQALAAATVWALSVTKSVRGDLVEQGVVEGLMTILESASGKAIADEALRDRLQAFSLGALSVMTVDGRARRKMFEADPGLTHFVKLAAADYVRTDAEDDENAEKAPHESGIAEDDAFHPWRLAEAVAVRVHEWGSLAGMVTGWRLRRQVVAVEAMSSALIRDPQGRIVFCAVGAMKSLLELLHVTNMRVRLCVAAVLACWPRDPESITAMAKSGMAPVLMHELLAGIRDAIRGIQQSTDLLTGEERTVALAFASRLLEASTSALWGAVCATLEADAGAEFASELDNFMESASLIIDTGETGAVGDAVHAIAGCLCAMAADATVSRFVMAKQAEYSAAGDAMNPRSPFFIIMRLLRFKNPTPPRANAAAMRTEDGKVLLPWDPESHGCFEGDEHIRACACATIAYLAGQDFESRGDDCFRGPYRRLLLDAGFMTAILRSVFRAPYGEILIWCAGAALMYLSTECGAIPAEDLELVLSMIEEAHDVETLNTMLPALWLLLHEPANRSWIGEAPVMTAAEKRAARFELAKLQAADRGDPPPEAPEPAGTVAALFGDAETGEGGPPAAPKEYGRCLKALVKIATRYFPELVRATDEAADVPVTYMFWLGSIWLLLYSDDDRPRGHEGVYEQMGPTWWSVPVPPALGVRAERPKLTAELLNLLEHMVRLSGPAHHKVRQFAIGLLWNLSVRDDGIEEDVIARGIPGVLAATVVDESLSPKLRITAAQYLHVLAETEADLRLEDSPSHVLNTAERPRGMAPVLEQALLTLMHTNDNSLTEFGARHVARVACGPHRKAALAEQGAVRSCVRLLKWYGASEETLWYAAMVLLNLSTHPPNQLIIARLAGRSLLRLNRDYRYSAETRGLTTSVLHNLATHADNTTRLYRDELAVKLEDVDRARSELGTRPGAWDSPVDSGVSGGPTWVKPATLRTADPEDPRLKFLEWAERTFEQAGPMSLQQERLKRLSSRVGLAATVGAPGGGSVAGSGGEGDSRQGSITGGLFPNASAGGRLGGMLPPLGGGGTPGGGSRSRRGEERFSKPELLSSLRSPQSSAWTPLPASIVNTAPVGKRQGGNRWCPIVASYQEPAPVIDPIDNTLVKLSGQAAKMLAMSRPYFAAQLHKAGATLASAVANDRLLPDGRILRTGRPMEARPFPPVGEELPENEPSLSALSAELSTASLLSIRSRASVRRRLDEGTEDVSDMDHHTPLAYLRPPGKTDNVRRPEATASRSGLLAKNAARKGKPLTLEELMRAEEERVQLAVQIFPTRARNLVSFALDTTRMTGAPRTTLFEHTAGCKVCEGLYGHYLLPTGKVGHIYDAGHKLIDEAEVWLDEPPPRPVHLADLQQDHLPLSWRLRQVSRPGPGSIRLFANPVPALPPVPDKHTLKVKVGPGGAKQFGDLQEDLLLLEVSDESTDKVEERIENKPVEWKEPWALPKSIWAPRARESDARDFYDTKLVLDKSFDKDWGRLAGKDKFNNFVNREFKKFDAKADPAEGMLRLKSELKSMYEQLLSSFKYFCALGSGSCFTLQLNEYTQFLDDCQIPDQESEKCKRSDCDTLFITCYFVDDPKLKNPEGNSLRRFEYIEAVCRIAVAKYSGGVATNDICEAIQFLRERNMSKMSDEAAITPNVFRQDRLYNEDIDMVFKPQLQLLMSIYSRYRVRMTNGRRPKLLRMEYWEQMLAAAKCITEAFTLRDAYIAYLRAQMTVADEIDDRLRFESMTFMDFLEGLARVADMLIVPSEEELKAMEYKSVMDWAINVEGGQRTRYDGVTIDEYHKVGPEWSGERMSAPPLHVKLKRFLDYFFRRLFYDPQVPTAEYAPNLLMKQMKKADADQGS